MVTLKSTQIKYIKSAGKEIGEYVVKNVNRFEWGKSLDKKNRRPGRKSSVETCPRTGQTTHN